RKAWPSTPASVCTVTTPRSLLPPNAPLAVRHASLFQLNTVTLTSVIFTLDLLISQVRMSPVWRDHRRQDGCTTSLRPGHGGAQMLVHFLCALDSDAPDGIPLARRWV